jgi:hypothetical protein
MVPRLKLSSNLGLPSSATVFATGRTTSGSASSKLNDVLMLRLLSIFEIGEMGIMLSSSPISCVREGLTLVFSEIVTGLNESPKFGELTTNEAGAQSEDTPMFVGELNAVSILPKTFAPRGEHPGQLDRYPSMCPPEKIPKCFMNKGNIWPSKNGKERAKWRQRRGAW